MSKHMSGGKRLNAEKPPADYSFDQPRSSKRGLGFRV